MADKVSEITAADVEFALDDVTVGDLADFQDASASGNLRLMCKALTHVVKRVPEAWGAADDVQTYLNLKRPAFNALMKALAAAFSAEAGN